VAVVVLLAAYVWRRFAGRTTLLGRTLAIKDGRV
jgi:hypothetical protein